MLRSVRAFGIVRRSTFVDGGGDAVQCSTVFSQCREKRLTLERVETATHLNPPGRFSAFTNELLLLFLFSLYRRINLELVSCSK